MAAGSIEEQQQLQDLIEELSDWPLDIPSPPPESHTYSFFSDEPPLTVDLKEAIASYELRGEWDKNEYRYGANSG